MNRSTLQFHTYVQELEKPWDEIERHNEFDAALLCRDLVDSWYRCFRGGCTPVLCSLWQDDVCMGIFPLLKEKKHGIVVLRNLGMDTYGICLPLVRREFRCRFFEEILALLRTSDFHWHVFKLSLTPSYNCSEFGVCRELFARSLGHCHLIQDTTFCVDLTAPYETYLKTYFSSHALKKQRYMRKQLEKRNYSVEFLQNDEALRHLDTFLEIENNGWKKECGTSILEVEECRSFSQTLARTMAAYKRLYIPILRIGGKPAAACLCYLENGVFNVMKTGFRQEYKSLSPSNALFMNLVEHLADNVPEARLLNFYPVSYGYKDKYASGCESFDTYVTPNATSVGKLLFFVYTMKMRYLGWRSSNKAAP